VELNSKPVIRHKDNVWRELKLQYGRPIGRCRVGGEKTTPRGMKQKRHIKVDRRPRKRFPKIISKWGRGR